MCLRVCLFYTLHHVLFIKSLFLSVVISCWLMGKITTLIAQNKIGCCWFSAECRETVLISCDSHSAYLHFACDPFFFVSTAIRFPFSLDLEIQRFLPDLLPVRLLGHNCDSARFMSSTPPLVNLCTIPASWRSWQLARWEKCEPPPGRSRYVNSSDIVRCWLALVDSFCLILLVAHSVDVASAVPYGINVTVYCFFSQTLSYSTVSLGMGMLFYLWSSWLEENRRCSD